MSLRTPNLARRPFLNTRPVVRVTVLLVVFGLLLAAANLWTFWSFSRGQGQKQDRLLEIRRELEAERQQIRELQQSLQRIDLEAQNEQVEFLNRKIQQRTFSWSLLFDTLSEILPREVRVTQLSLEGVGGDDRPRGRRASVDQDGLRPGEIGLSIEGEAQNYEALLDLLDALFVSPVFRDPNPSGDTRGQTGAFQFNLHVVYLPVKAAALAEAEDVLGETAAEASDGTGSTEPGGEEGEEPAAGDATERTAATAGDGEPQPTREEPS